MPKGKKDDLLEFDFSKGDEQEGSDANPKDAITGESLFDDLSPRFQRQLDAAAEKASGRKPPKNTDDDLDADEELEDEDDLDPSDEDEDEEDEPEHQEEADELEEEDEDADEPRPGRRLSPVERRVARANRLVEETRAQLAEMQNRERDREARAQLAASESEFNTFKADAESKLADLKAKKVKAIEDGDTAAQVDLDDQITDLKGELRSRTNEFERAKKEVEESGKRKTASPITLTMVAQWKRKNPRYEKDREFAAVVNGLDAQLVQGGSNPESPEHYKELDRRLKKIFPDHGGKKPQRRHPSQQVTREAPASAQRRPAGDARVEVKGNKIKISPAKLARVKANMVKFNLDPSNPKDLKDYLLNNPGI